MRRWVAPAALGAVLLGHAALLSRFLVYRDLSLDYPFRGADDLDWIGNALALGGADIRYTGRLPLYPLLLLGLQRLGALAWAPVLQQALVLGLALAVFWLVRQRHSPAVAAVTAAWLGLGHVVQDLALGISADLLAVTLLALATWLWLASRMRPPWLVAAAALAGLSAVTQPGALLWLAVAALLTLPDSRRPKLQWLVASGAVCALPAAVWRWFGPAGSGADRIVRHGELLGWSLGNVPFYALAALALVGLPGAVVLARGVIAAWRERGSLAARFALLHVALVGLFFATVYSFAAGRLLLYAAPSLALLVGGGLAAFESRRWLFAGMSVLLLAGAAWPSPAGSPEPAAVLWPVPTVTLQLAPATGGGWRAATRVGAQAAWRDTALGRAIQARQQAVQRPSVPPGAVEGIDGVVYLSAAGESADERYRHQYRLGNVLLRRVRVVAAGLYPDSWWSGGRFQSLGRVGATEIFRGHWLGGPEFAVATEDPVTLAALRAPAAAAGGPDVSPEQWALARSIAGRAAPPDGFLLVLGEPQRDGDWMRVLPVVARTTSLFVPTGDDLATAAALAKEQPCSQRQRVEDVELCRMHIRWPVLVAVAPSYQGAVLDARSPAAER